MKKIIDIHEGFTNNYLIHGVIGLGIALILLSISLVFGIFAFLLCLIIFMGTNGLEIDLMNKQYRAYGSFLGYKTGTWLSLKEPVFAQLSISSENRYVGGVSGMAGSMVPNRGKLKSLTYDISLESKNGKWTTIYSFLDYKMAKIALKKIEIGLEIPIHDKVKEKLLINQEKRRNRGY